MAALPTSNAWKRTPSHVVEKMRAMRKGTALSYVGDLKWRMAPSYVGDLKKRMAPSHVVEGMRAMHKDESDARGWEQIRGGGELHPTGFNRCNCEFSPFLYSIVLSYQRELQLFRLCAITIFICLETDVGKLRLLGLVELESNFQRCCITKAVLASTANSCRSSPKKLVGVGRRIQ